MKLNVEISRLPNEYNLQSILEKRIAAEYKSCPYCGERNEMKVYECHSDYTDGYKPDEKNILKRIKLGKRKWVQREYKCTTCGVKWKSRWYEHDITEGMDLTKYLEEQMENNELNNNVENKLEEK